jgi:hypothetical protein
MATMHRLLVAALVTAAILALNEVRLSKGDPLPTPKPMMVWVHE